jgi:hypothetical protein
MSFDSDPYITATIDGTPLSTGAWYCLNPQELLSFAPQAQDNVRLAGVDGVLARPTYDDQQTVDLQFVLTGNHTDPPLDTYPTPEARLAAVKRLFAVAFFRAPRDANGCVTCEVIDIDGTTYSGDVQVGPPKFGEGLFECNAVMSITIIDGELGTGS